ncbi:MAG: DNA polymerase III subunit gamma/tau [Clostridiaceae bacterium]|nr:DNA polymerase III subunit gamma/tau [Clostridiaceae bacterium]
MSSRLALYRKWRPLTFDEVYGQAHVTDALRAQVASGRVSHAYLFTGTRGTGKTTCAKILARAVCCEAPVNGNPCNECAACRSVLDESALDVSEIDAASNNSVDDVRALRDEVSFTPAALKKRVYIIDEVHMLSTSAFNALLKTLEEPPEHALFILATTELHKVPATILSRCQRFDFRRIPPEIIGARLRHIAEREGYTLDDDACALLARLADGSMRDGVSLLDRSLPEKGSVTYSQVTESLGVAPAETVAAIVLAVMDGDAARALAVFSEAYLEGRDVLSLFDELLSFLRDLYVLRATGREEYLVSAAAADPAQLRSMAARVSPEELAFFVTCVSDLLTRLTRTAIRRTDGEMCLMRMALRGGVRLADETVRPPAAASATTRSDKSVPDTQRCAAEKPPAESPPWDVPAPQPAAELSPIQREDIFSGNGADTRSEIPESMPRDGDRLREAFLSLAGSKVTAPVRTYLKTAEFSDKNGTLLIRVNDAVLNIVSKQSTLDTLQAAAQALSYTGVRVEKLTSEKPSGALDSLLENARQLGVQTN